MSKKTDLLQILQHQQARLSRRLDRLHRQSDRLSRWRLILFLGALLLGGAAFLQWGPVVWLASTAVLLIPFIISVAIHRRVETAVTRFSLWQKLKQTHLARMTLAWEELPETKSFEVSSDHPYAVDIDLVGAFSLHRLLDTAVSQEGSQRLHNWLLDPNPEKDVVLTRQNLVKELSSQTRFRERLWLQASLAIGEDGAQWAGQSLLDWLQNEAEAKSLRPLLIGLSVLTVVNWVLFAGYQFGGWPPLWLGTILLYGVLFITFGFQRTATLFEDAMFLTDRLRVLHGVFGYLEDWPYKNTPHLAQLCHPFLLAGERPSAHIQKVQRVVAGVGLRQNWLLGFVLNALLPWDIYFAYRLDHCRDDLAAQLPNWLDSWFELEAAGSLATFAYLNPGEWVWPTLVDSSDPEIRATDMGHPLIPRPKRVCNDLRLDSDQSIYLITGSNMAGKSSFLRTIGVNLALAYAGGPVVAQSFHASWLRLFATIRIADSLNDGFSFFYAEVRRLSQLLTALHEDEERPLLFLIDEIFRGTNNRERLIGSRAYIEALVKGSGLGAIATHDLELVQLAKTAEKLVNVHFRDDVVNGRMVFDYKLHNGPCPTTNALKIMALAGLPVTRDS